MDWKDILGSLKEEGNLPPGEDIQDMTPPQKEKKKDRLHVSVEKKGRNGKVATIVDGFTVSDSEVAEVATVLKKKLGVGGSSRGGEILIQGNLADKVRAELKALGYKL